ncbi:glycosyltransferase family 4 protein [Salinibacterium sp. SYSU T00001]|uniref:glycosyltransferase family 4 protein n=1 Tax=Homoserinimonas sedimenticola TaxID=2986805 RepID=UPI00223669A6|nr:glycosyltransferase family 4 protein [Salinibacterium sedimenticola]MCW4385033.1 glycosyltransferase family 4 protein [Salinibacterium sedimenticola]
MSRRRLQSRGSRPGDCDHRHRSATSITPSIIGSSEGRVTQVEQASDPVRIVHVSSVHSWSDNRIYYRECTSLQAMGYKVTLVAVESTVDAERTDVDVVTLRRLPRLVRASLGSVLAIAAGLRTGAKLFHLHDPELTWAIPLLRGLGKRVIYDAHEDLLMQIDNKKYVTPALRPFMIVAARVSLGLARRANHVVTATETIAERFSASRVTTVHNYPTLSADASPGGPVASRPRSLVYVGAISERRGVIQMVDAIASSAFPEGWRLQLAGPMPADLRARVSASAGWAGVEYHGPVSPSHARGLMQGSRVGFVVLQSNAAYLDSLPTKMFEYFAAGTPVIASDFPLWRRIIEEHDCGLVVDEKDPDAIAAAVARYSEEPDLLDRHSRNALRAAKETFNWDAETVHLRAAYRKAVE